MYHLLFQTQDDIREAIGNTSLLDLLLSGGVVTIVLSVIIVLHKSTVEAYKEIAKTQREIANIERKRADAATDQLQKLMQPIQEKAKNEVS